MSTHWLDCPFLTQPRWEWWSDPLPVPQGFCFCRWKRPRRTRPGEEEESQPQGQICFSDLQNCNACICPWLAGLSLPKRRDRRHHGGWNAAATPLGRRKPKHTCDVLTNPQRPQVGDLSSLTSQRIWPGGDGDALRLQQRKLHLHAPVRLPEDCRPIIFWDLEKVEDMAFWRHLGSPRHLMYITRPYIFLDRNHPNRFGSPIRFTLHWWLFSFYHTTGSFPLYWYDMIISHRSSGWQRIPIWGRLSESLGWCPQYTLICTIPSIFNGIFRDPQ